MIDRQDFGVCRFSIVPVYEQPDYHSKQYNQILFGEHYSVTGSKGNWISVQLAYDLSGGWISKSQHHTISKDYFDQINISDYKITTDIASTILYNKTPIHIVLGSIVPISNSELFKMEEQLAFNGESKSLGQKRDIEFLKAILTKYSNTPYLPGGKSPFGIDSGGLIQMSFKICGYKLPRSVEEQMNCGKVVSEFNQAMPGDLIFLRKSDRELISSILVSDEKVILVGGYTHQEQIDLKGIKAPGQKKHSMTIECIRRIL
jgi:hypothetical protein